MVGIFGDQHLGDGGLRRQPTLDQPRRRRGLHDAIRALAAGIFRPDRDQHPELRRHDVEPLALVFADPVQRAGHQPEGGEGTTLTFYSGQPL